MNSDELVALHAALGQVLAWPDSIRSEIARWLAPNDVGGNSPPALDTDKENNGAKDASGGNPPLKPNGRDRHPPPERVAADNSFPIASTPRRAKARRNNAKSAEQRLLQTLRDSPGLSANAVAKAASVSRETTRERLQQLAARGTVERDTETGLWRLKTEVSPSTDARTLPDPMRAPPA